MTKRGLGRGLDVFFPNANADENEEFEKVLQINVKEIRPNKFQPRKTFDEEKLADLAQSIKLYGVLQPIVVRKIANGYEIVAGERRLRASKLAGTSTIPAVIRDYTDAEITEIALIENLQRQDLNPIEEGLAFKQLIEEFGLTQEEVAQKIGRSRSAIANMIRLLNLHPQVQEHVSRGTLSIGQARPLLSVEDFELQLELANRIIEDDLTARDVEELVKHKANTRKPEKITEYKELFVAEAEDKLKLILGTQVKIKPGKLKSKIEIEFYSSEDLERILETISLPAIKQVRHVGPLTV